VLGHHTAEHRAALLETYLDEALGRETRPVPRHRSAAGGEPGFPAPRLVATAPK